MRILSARDSEGPRFPLKEVGKLFSETGTRSVLTAAAEGRSRRTQPKAAAEDRGPRPRPKAAAAGCGHGPCAPWAHRPMGPTDPLTPNSICWALCSHPIPSTQHVLQGSHDCSKRQVQHVCTCAPEAECSSTQLLTMKLQSWTPARLI